MFIRVLISQRHHMLDVGYGPGLRESTLSQSTVIPTTWAGISLQPTHDPSLDFTVAFPRDHLPQKFCIKSLISGIQF